MKINDQSVCRICLKTNCETSIKSECVVEHFCLTLLEIFNVCTQLEAKLEDAYPQYLCNECIIQLKNFYEFRLKAKSIDTKLRQKINEKNFMLIFYNDENKEETESQVESTIKTEVEILNYGRDPLEDSDNGATTDIEGTGENMHHFNESSEDEEDNKPLVDLLIKSSGNYGNVSKMKNDELTENEKEEKLLENDFDCNTNEVSVSIEDQIFPQGRIKCKTCGKLYFTLKGLDAHIIVHLQNTKNATKQKRKRRNTNKRKQKLNLKTIDKQKHKNQTECLTESINTINTDNEIHNDNNELTILDNTKQKTTNEHLNLKCLRKNKPPKPKKMYPCHVCGKQMISASKLRYHMVMHTGEKDYLCTMCPKAYSTIYALKHHLRTHTGERPYECRFCGDRFTRPTTLKSHIRRHTNERPYGCDICGKRFIQHSSMTTHIKLNHMAKTIPCPHCEKKYARQTDLNTHLLSHTGNKPFSCQLCSSRFIRLANLNKHMNQHHTFEKQTESHNSKTLTKTTTTTTTTTTRVKSTKKSIVAENIKKFKLQLPLKQQQNDEENCVESLEFYVQNINNNVVNNDVVSSVTLTDYIKETADTPTLTPAFTTTNGNNVDVANSQLSTTTLETVPTIFEPLQTFLTNATQTFVQM